MVQLTEEEWAEIQDNLNCLAAFKKYVHDRLDAAGVPADPDSPHKAEGCRIGGRLDWVLGRRDCAAVPSAKLADSVAAFCYGYYGSPISPTGMTGLLAILDRRDPSDLLYAALVDFRDHGTRHDLHPTMLVQDWPAVYAYLKGMDDYVRRAAGEALSGERAPAEVVEALASPNPDRDESQKQWTD